MDLKLAIIPDRFRIAVLGHSPFSEEAPGIITII